MNEFEGSLYKQVQALAFEQTEEDQENDEIREEPPLTPMSPIEASSTVVNLLLATGPFSYPYSFVGLGPILSTLIIAICSILAYVSATFMVEAIAMA